MQKIVVAIIATAVVVGMLSAFGSLAALASKSFQSPTTGQPGAPTNTCPTTVTPGVQPGQSASAGGSPFNPTGGIPNGNPTGGGGAGNNYAGNPNTASLAYSNSGASVSQYDTACFH